MAALKALLLLGCLGAACAYHGLRAHSDPRAAASDVDFEPIEHALLPLSDSASQTGALRLSPRVERALHRAVQAFPHEPTPAQQQRIAWLTQQVIPQHGADLSRLLQQYYQYAHAAEALRTESLSGTALLQQKIHLQQQHFGPQAAQHLFAAEHQLLQRLSATASTQHE